MKPGPSSWAIAEIAGRQGVGYRFQGKMYETSAEACRAAFAAGFTHYTCGRSLKRLWHNVRFTAEEKAANARAQEIRKRNALALRRKLGL